MANLIKLSEEKKRTLIADTIMQIEREHPIKSDEDFESFLKCIYSIKQGTFVEAHFHALFNIPCGQIYWRIIRDLALKGNIDSSIMETFEEKYIR